MRTHEALEQAGIDLKLGTKTCKRALIVKLGAIGDVIMAVPAAYALYQQGFSIDWVCGKTVRPLLECYSWVNPIPVNDKAILTGTPWQRLEGILDLWRKIGLKRYTLCSVLYYDSRYKLLTAPVRAERKQMFSQNSRATTMIAGRHRTDEYMRLILGTDDTCRETSTAPIRPDRLPASPLPPKGARPQVALVPGAGNHLIRAQASARLPEQFLRRWPIESYVALAHKLLDRGWEVVLLGGPEDVWVEPHFKQFQVTNFIGKLTLPEFVSFCDQCDAVVTHDTGPLHLAGLSETCLISIFGPTDPTTLLPRRSCVTGIWGGQGFACRPCYDGRDFAPCKFNGCMHQVTPELVMHELDRLLDARARHAPSPWRIVYPGMHLQPEANTEFVSLTPLKPRLPQL